MVISVDHDCTVDCPICIPEDLSKFVKERKIVPRSTPISFAMLFLYIPCALLAIAASFWGASAIFGLDMALAPQSHVAGLSGDQSSIGLAERLGDQSSVRLAERLEHIEHLLKDIRLLLDESEHVMRTKEASTSAIDDSNPGPSLSRDNFETPTPRAASSIERKPDEPAARNSTGNDFVLYLITASLIITWLAVRGYIFWNFGLDFSWGTDGNYSGGDSEFWTDPDYFGGDSGCWTDPDYSGGDSDSETDSDYSGQVSARGLLGSLTSIEFNKALTQRIRNVGSEDAQLEEVDYASRRDEESRAATMVQARYRGHLVRMSRPLVQLREIAGIEEKLKKLKELTEDSGFVDFLRMKGSLAMLAVEEETLKLLLLLDNIQGSDHLVCQIRKSVAREIVFTQESFDALLS